MANLVNKTLDLLTIEHGDVIVDVDNPEYTLIVIGSPIKLPGDGHYTITAEWPITGWRMLFDLDCIRKLAK